MKETFNKGICYCFLNPCFFLHNTILNDSVFIKLVSLQKTFVRERAAHVCKPQAKIQKDERHGFHGNKLQEPGMKAVSNTKTWCNSRHM